MRREVACKSSLQDRIKESLKVCAGIIIFVLLLNWFNSSLPSFFRCNELPVMLTALPIMCPLIILFYALGIIQGGVHPFPKQEKKENRAILFIIIFSIVIAFLIDCL
ncbi:hypothetical protein [Zooshikella harenae]|uniref:DUF2933 domain-containing protein n=1 Tax=Zooshikella harenae TaxID=2827238 RepID=A0ABS5Z9K0_9GAMM|nr:hypothetical protein [Zooshikella harenae]MBU2710722.1 hypothetical protein [Zooshikella harenae]